MTTRRSACCNRSTSMARHNSGAGTSSGLRTGPATTPTLLAVLDALISLQADDASLSILDSAKSDIDWPAGADLLAAKTPAGVRS